LLYAGDDDIDRAAVYLSTILHASGYGFDYIPSTEHCPTSVSFADYGLIILSDYPSKNFPQGMLDKLSAAIRNGSTLLMIGGWESFTGMNIEYLLTPVQDVLPVQLLREDDRRNFYQGCLVLPTTDSQVFSDLDWEHPPLIGGLNEVVPRANARIHLEAFPLRISASSRERIRIESIGFPLLVASPIGRGFSVALAVDLAPHWVGGLVDWGPERVRLDFEDRSIEVGSHYLRFVQELITFCLSKGTVAS
jgi:uncharacterized membrane protein